MLQQLLGARFRQLLPASSLCRVCCKPTHARSISRLSARQKREVDESEGALDAREARGGRLIAHCYLAPTSRPSPRTSAVASILNSFLRSRRPPSSPTRPIHPAHGRWSLGEPGCAVLVFCGCGVLGSGRSRQTPQLERLTTTTHGYARTQLGFWEVAGLTTRAAAVYFARYLFFVITRPPRS